jgi:hypothetical protein
MKCISIISQRRFFLVSEVHFVTFLLLITFQKPQSPQVDHIPEPQSPQVDRGGNLIKLRLQRNVSQIEDEERISIQVLLARSSGED